MSLALYLPTYSKNRFFPFFLYVAKKIVEKGIKTNISTFPATPTCRPKLTLVFPFFYEPFPRNIAIFCFCFQFSAALHWQTYESFDSFKKFALAVLILRDTARLNCIGKWNRFSSKGIFNHSIYFIIMLENLCRNLANIA